MISVFFHQPYFLPWLGFFCRLAQTSVYVALDDAYYRRQHVSRVEILGIAGQKQRLKMPIGGSRNKRMNELILPADTSYVDRLLKTISHSYSRATYFKSEFPFIADL